MFSHLQMRHPLQTGAILLFICLISIEGSTTPAGTSTDRAAQARVAPRSIIEMTPDEDEVIRRERCWDPRIKLGVLPRKIGVLADFIGYDGEHAYNRGIARLDVLVGELESGFGGLTAPADAACG